MAPNPVAAGLNPPNKCPDKAKVVSRLGLAVWPVKDRLLIGAVRAAYGVTAVREGTGMEDFSAPRVPTRDVPEKNRELVKPYLKQMDEWIPLAFFGL